MNFTQLAQTKLTEIAKNEKIVDPVVRVKIAGGGCAGFQYDMSFLEPTEMYDPESDEVFEFDSFTAIVDPISAQYLEETTVDWTESPTGEGFKFLNPNVKGSCGCGNSVSF